jgi:membrane-bound lytic murein transglycosylase D
MRKLRFTAEIGGSETQGEDRADRIKWLTIGCTVLGMVGCSTHHPGTARTATAADQVGRIAAAAPQRRFAPANGSAAADRSAAVARSVPSQNDDELVFHSLLDASAADESSTSAQWRAEASDRAIWDRLRGGFSLSFEDRSSIKREIDAFSARTLERNLAQSSEYLYLVLDEVERRGMPAEIALLPLVESGYNPAAVSPGKAAGLWQFLPQTARNFGLKLTQSYDGRHDVMASTRAALDYMDHLGDMFGGDWLLALTAYNTGEGTVQRWIQQNRQEGKPTDFFALPIPLQTRRYIPRLMAMREVIDNPRRYGVELPDIPNRPVLDSVDVQGRLDLATVADAVNLSPSQVLRYNPGIQAKTRMALSSPLLLPAVHARRLQQYLDDPQNAQLAQNTVAAPEGAGDVAQDLRVEADRVLEKPARPERSTRTHVVRSGDSLYSIAKLHGVDSAAVAKANKLSPKATLKVGQTLRIVAPEHDERQRPAQRHSSYAVRQGDTLGTIAGRFGISVADLAKWNGIKPNSVLRLGQLLAVRAPDGSRRAIADGSG